MLYTYAATALIAAAIAFTGGWKAHSYKTKADERDRMVALEKDRTRTAAQTFRAHEVKDAETIRINERLADALERLRDRPVRLPEPARAACKGSTGRELSGQDAAAFERLAADAERQRAALSECYAWVDAVRGMESGGH